MTHDFGKITADHFDHGAQIGVLVERNGVTRFVRIPNPFCAEIDAEWQATHPKETA